MITLKLHLISQKMFLGGQMNLLFFDIIEFYVCNRVQEDRHHEHGEFDSIKLPVEEQRVSKTLITYNFSVQNLKESIINYLWL